MPTGGERLVWGMGDGSTMPVLDSPFGRLSGLICWENHMPLARAALYAQGVDIYLAPTWDDSDVWVAAMQHIAVEGRTYVIGVNTCQRAADVPAGVPGRDELYATPDDWMSRGRSVIVGPDGAVPAGPTIDREDILLTELDIGGARRSRHAFDPAGHYAPPDAFRLSIDTAPRPSARFDN
jgi:nitrilase